MIDAARRVLRRWRRKVDTSYRTVQGYAQGEPATIAGEQLGLLRHQVIDDPCVPYRAGICNSGLLRTSIGYLAVAKNNTYCFCAEHGLEAALGPRHWPPRSSLLEIELDDGFHVTRVSRLRVVRDGTALDRETDLCEDVRLTEVGGETWCSVNVICNGRLSQARPGIGRLAASSAELRIRSIPIPRLRTPQKNWIPFACGDELFIQYSVNPHVVLRLDGQTSTVTERYSSWFASAYWGLRGPFYRGGSSLAPFDGSYLGAAHSAVLVNGRRDYRTHFYLTDPRPPFKIRWFGRPVKLLRAERIQYISALLVGSDGRLVVSYGVNDCDNVFASLRADDVKATLARV